MQITSARLMRRRTHAQYEHSEVEVFVDVDLTRNINVQLAEARKIVEMTLFPEKFDAPVEDKQPPKEEVKATAPVKETKPKATKTEAKAETKVEAKIESEVSGEVPPVIPEEAKVEAPKKKASKVINYDSTVPSQKMKLSSLLNTEFDGWKVAPEGMEQSTYNNKVKEFTGSLNDKPFEDENGEVVKSFKELIATWLKSVKK